MIPGFLANPLWSKISELKGIEKSGDDLYETIEKASDKQYKLLYALYYNNKVEEINKVIKTI